MVSEGMKETPVISLGKDFGAAVVEGNGIRITLNSDGSVEVFTNGAVKMHPAANGEAKARVMKWGL